MTAVKTLIHDFSRLFFPHHCAGCGTDILNKESPLCIRCLHDLPVTNFHLYAGNPLEQRFTGRMPLVSGTAHCYFGKQTVFQHILYGFKYKGNKEVGYLLGRLMGKALKDSGRFTGIDALVPLPLHPAKERKRGYNQAAVLCEGMAKVLQVPVVAGAVIRVSSTSSQTGMNRLERWENMQGRFQLVDPGSISSKHLLLVDDVITTGATLDACAQALLQVPGMRLSVAVLGYREG